MEKAISDDYVSLYPVLDGVRLKWHIDYWDGPISGIAEFDNRLSYFSQCDSRVKIDPDSGEIARELPGRWRRRFLLYELTEEELNEELHWHQLFQESVGTHTDYDESGNRNLDGVRDDPAKRDAFYKAYQQRPPTDFSNNKIIGWFQR